ncbi:transposase [Xenorhabdus mauleonii]|uniref:InsA C-terminal domain-containing protein n=1 Tax=Xenorhabdus mauleonii TaxID=351675 RepID=A0A1I3SGF7_9GAMM|nr:transposase [Xenorhabdus mauleonii]SFJ57818.1 InsA C-terminal domain-containing protein [Xenorhabdus mauleonii]
MWFVVTVTKQKMLKDMEKGVVDIPVITAMPAKTFQLNYTYQACKPGMKEQIADMAMNNSGIRDTARVLKVGINTVLRTLKSSRREM